MKAYMFVILFFAVTILSFPAYSQESNIQRQNRRARENFMRQASLTSEYRSDRSGFFNKYIKGRYIVDAGILKKAEKWSFSVVQVLDDNMLLCRFDTIFFVLKGVDTTGVVDNQYFSSLLQEDGVYQYTSVAGSVRTVKAYRLRNTITETEFNQLAAAGFDFVNLVLEQE